MGHRFVQALRGLVDRLDGVVVPNYTSKSKLVIYGVVSSIPFGPRETNTPGFCARREPHLPETWVETAQAGHVAQGGMILNKQYDRVCFMLRRFLANACRSLGLHRCDGQALQGCDSFR
jgi:hypothetical protein